LNDERHFSIGSGDRNGNLDRGHHLCSHAIRSTFLGLYVVGGKQFRNRNYGGTTGALVAVGNVTLMDNGVFSFIPRGVFVSGDSIYFSIVSRKQRGWTSGVPFSFFAP